MASYSVSSVVEYLSAIPSEQKPYVEKVRKAILSQLDKGFEECINYGMIGYVVPKSLYPEGYHCDPKLPLPFAGLAAQKNSINLYHMGIYADDYLLKWFQAEYMPSNPNSNWIWGNPVFDGRNTRTFLIN